MEQLSESQKLDRERLLSDYSGVDKVISSIEFKQQLDSAGAPLIKFYSQIPSLDVAIEGFEGGELIVISGPTKNGKTTFAQTLTRNFELQNIKSLWFSYEVTPRQLFAKFVSAKEFYLPAQLRNKDLPWLESKIIESKLKFDTRAVFIDHLHYLVDMAQARNPSIEIGTIIRTLKLIAVEHNIVIILLAHTTKVKTDQTPTESDVRDSSFIPQEADSTLMVWRQQQKDRKTRELKTTGKTFVRVSNHRRTGAMGTMIALSYHDGTFTETQGGDITAGTEQKGDDELFQL